MGNPCTVCGHMLPWVSVQVYLAISDECALDLETFLDAFYFSLITMSTIGYGTADMHFNDCSSALFISKYTLTMTTTTTSTIITTATTVTNQSWRRHSWVRLSTPRSLVPYTPRSAGHSQPHTRAQSPLWLVLHALNIPLLYTLDPNRLSQSPQSS